MLACVIACLHASCVLQEHVHAFFRFDLPAFTMLQMLDLGSSICIEHTGSSSSSVVVSVVLLLPDIFAFWLPSLGRPSAS